MVKDLLFALELGMKIIMTFVLCIFIGMKLDTYLNTDNKVVLVMIFIAFFIVMKTLLGVMKRGRI